MDLEFDCDRVTADSIRGRVKCEASDVDANDVFDHIERSHLDEFVDRVGKDVLLDKIGESSAMEHFGLEIPADS